MGYISVSWAFVSLTEGRMGSTLETKHSLFFIMSSFSWKFALITLANTVMSSLLPMSTRWNLMLFISVLRVNHIHSQKTMSPTTEFLSYWSHKTPCCITVIVRGLNCIVCEYPHVYFTKVLEIFINIYIKYLKVLIYSPEHGLMF